MLKTMKGQKMGNLFVSVAQNPVVLSATNLQIKAFSPPV